ncbi:aminodeoxychorismate lyase [Bacillus sp. Marseille-P3661]|uniref:aminodeoxychorismate lyase n=1 Tax=Bacillus sp. Marseille-P3661 TaxID=1936234 RepID=UPI000C865485|nr:aminodeoxychorismate lyase [Bacillus sp. Marseille-P3661]
MYVYINGEIIDQNLVKISPFDHGFMYGLGLFETFRVDEGHPFLLEDHIHRLKKGLVELNIKWDYDTNKIVSVLDQLLKANGLSHAYIRLNVSAGTGEVGLQTRAYESPTTIIYIKPLAKSHMLEKEAVLLRTRRNTPEGSYRLKSHHYLNNILAKREIGDDSSKEGLFLNEQGFVCEGIVSNIFWIKNRVVYTPDSGTGLLNGITREFVLTLLQKLNIKYEVGYYEKETLIDCDEAFVTNSIQEVVPLIGINGQVLPGGKGSITNKVSDLYQYYKQKKLWSKAEVL